MYVLSASGGFTRNSTALLIMKPQNALHIPQFDMKTSDLHIRSLLQVQGYDLTILSDDKAAPTARHAQFTLSQKLHQWCALIFFRYLSMMRVYFEAVFLQDNVYSFHIFSL